MLKSMSDCLQAANQPETLTILEELVSAWCKQIEQVKILYLLYILKTDITLVLQIPSTERLSYLR